MEEDPGPRVWMVAAVRNPALVVLMARTDQPDPQAFENEDRS